MDFSKADKRALAAQLRKPEGAMGEEVGKVLAGRHVEQMAFVFDYLDIQPTDHILEIGFGPGEAIAEAARLAPQGFVAGIDFSDTMLRMAEHRNHRAVMQEHVELTFGDAKELPYADESFDKVFAMNVFHFWPDPTRELAECLRVLKPGGLVLFYMSHPSSWIPGINETGLFVAREPEEAAALLQQAGFRDAAGHSKTFGDHGEKKGYLVLGIK